jgi:GAF domain-containing protein
MPSTSSYVRYIVAICAVLASLLATQWFANLYQQGILFLMLGAVMLASWFGGRGPGYVAAALATLGSLYFLVPPVFSIQFTGPQDIIRLVLFTGVSLLIVFLTDLEQRTNAMLLKTQDRLHQEIARRQHAEEAIKADSQTLEQYVFERTRQLNETTQRLQVLCNVSQEVNSVLNLPVIMTTLVQSAMQLTQAEGGFYGLLQNGELVLMEYHRSARIVSINVSFAKGCGLPGHVLQTQETYVCNEAAVDPYLLPERRDEFGIRNLVNVPIISRDRAFLGCFEVLNKNNGTGFDELDVQLLESLAASAAIAIENAHREEALRLVNQRLEGEVQERTTELLKVNEVLNDKIQDLEKFSDVVVGRELKMMDLEKEVLRLREELNSAPSK